VHVLAAFCGELPNAAPQEPTKDIDLADEKLVGAIGIEPMTFPV
jgi:hypothetical protein